LSPGDERDFKSRLPGAYLGIDIAADPSGRYRITKVLRGDGFRNSERSPLLGPGRTVKEGMFLLAIGGQELRVGEDPWAALEGRAGATVSVTLNDKPSFEGAKTFLVKPVPSEARMRYLEWVRANREYVAKKSGGKVGYIHLSAMDTEDMEDFIRQYFAQRDKEALLVDSRFNNGGFVQDYINRILNSRLDGYFNMRDSPHSWTRQQDYFNGPIAMVMNEFNISCGEEFPHRFRNLGRGVLIGRRTMGGEVGSAPGWPLIDGGSVNVPNYGMWVPGKGWVIEGPGVSPDIDVPSDPQAYVEGRDPQLDKAIEWLLKEIPRQPSPVRVQPADPRPGIG
jgi:tricorn protease